MTTTIGNKLRAVIITDNATGKRKTCCYECVPEGWRIEGYDPSPTVCDSRQTSIDR